MKQFRLSRQPSGPVLTKFYIYDGAGDLIGAVNVRNEQASDLERHWPGGATQPKAAAITKKGGALAAALEAAKRPGSLAPSPSRDENPAIDAMLRAARQNRLTKQAVLRGC
jgi:hypothetical protein